MRKILSGLLLGLSLIFVLGASCSKNSSTQSNTPVAINNVTISNFAFNPQTVTINSGSVVTWENKDSTAHQIVTDGNLPDLSSGLIEQNNTFSFTFSSAGTYNYHCNIHPEMKGEVIVK